MSGQKYIIIVNLKNTKSDPSRKQNNTIKPRSTNEMDSIRNERSRVINILSWGNLLRNRP